VRRARPSPATLLLLLLPVTTGPALARASGGTVALDTGACDDVPADALRAVVSVELGELLAPPDVSPAPGGYHLAVVCRAGEARLEVRAAAGEARLERTLRLDDFPRDAAPRALALAGIETLAVLDPEVRAHVEARPARAPQPPGTFALAASAVYRAFLQQAGAMGWGGRVGADYQRGPWIAAADLELDRATTTLDDGTARAWLASLGAFGGVGTNGGRVTGVLAAGARGGLAWLSGTPAPDAPGSGHSVTRPWWGPAVAARVAFGGARGAAAISLEAGWVVRGAQGLAGGTKVIAIEGGWMVAGLGVRF
jgi:hypothetical protein